MLLLYRVIECNLLRTCDYAVGSNELNVMERTTCRPPLHTACCSGPSLKTKHCHIWIKQWIAVYSDERRTPLSTHLRTPSLSISKADRIPVVSQSPSTRLYNRRSYALRRCWHSLEQWSRRYIACFTPLPLPNAFLTFFLDKVLVLPRVY